jgi:predicted Zn-dependent protease
MTWKRSLVLAVALAAAWSPARAEKNDKKKPNPILDFFDPRTGDREAARKLAPVPLEDMVSGAARGEARVLRLRVYADQDYRGSTLHWQKKVRGQVERVNHIVAAAFNVRFEIESLRQWDRSHLGQPFEPMLQEIEALDTAQDVDWVVGFVTSFRGVARSIHQVGGAHLASRHFVLRGMDDQEEGRELAQSLNMLPTSEREALYEDRKAHKEVVVFLHEWGHSMGALHAEDPRFIMNPSLDPKQTEFTPFQRRVIALVLDRRLADRTRPFPESADLLPLMRDAPTGEGTDAERASLVKLLEARAKGGVAAGPGRAGLSVAQADITTYNRAVEALNAGRREEAWTTVAPVLAKYPREPRLLSLACSLVAGQPGAADARAACEAAIALAPTDPTPMLEAAACHLRAGAPTAAAPLVAAAAKASEKGADDDTLIRLARIASSAGALTVAEGALARASKGAAKAPEAGNEIAATRRRVGLPPDPAATGVTPEDEPAYVAGYWAAAHDVDEPATPESRARVAAFLARFPRAPGVKVLGCTRELRAGHAAAAVKLCQAAVAAYPESVRANLLLGVAAANSGHAADAEKALRRAILLDPSDPDPWRTLAGIYRSMRARSKLDQLAREHQALLSSPLPD